MAAEATLQRKTIAHARRLGMEVIRMAFAPGVSAGWPDALFLVPGGRPLFVEFKAPGRKPSPLQQHRISYLCGAGYDVRVADNFDTARQALASAVERARLS